MGISVESVLLGAGLPVHTLKPRARANSGPVSEGRGADWEAPILTSVVRDGGERAWEVEWLIWRLSS